MEIIFEDKIKGYSFKDYRGFQLTLFFAYQKKR
jgi:hypothetical protein